MNFYYSHIRRLTTKVGYTRGHNAIGEVAQETARGHPRYTPFNIQSKLLQHSEEEVHKTPPPINITETCGKENTRDANTMGKAKGGGG